jgi:hypothetical protein
MRSSEGLEEVSSASDGVSRKRRRSNDGCISPMLILDAGKRIRLGDECVSACIYFHVLTVY